MTSDSSQPEDYAGLVVTQDKGRNTLFYVVVVVFVLLLVGYFTMQSPEKEIELEAPAAQHVEKADPAVPNLSEAKQQTQASDQSAPQAQGEAAAGLAGISSKSTADIASLRADISAQTSAPGETARALIGSIRAGEKNPSLDQLCELADEQKRHSMNTDAYLLYFYAARKGYGPAAFELAKMNDPAYFEGGSDLLDEPDPMQAFKWYSVAVEQHVAGAEENLLALRESVETAAQSGDMSAQRLLLNWK